MYVYCIYIYMYIAIYIYIYYYIIYIYYYIIYIYYYIIYILLEDASPSRQQRLAWTLNWCEHKPTLQRYDPDVYDVWFHVVPLSRTVTEWCACWHIDMMCPHCSVPPQTCCFSGESRTSSCCSDARSIFWNDLQVILMKEPPCIF